MPVDNALIEALLAPIPGENPSGRELRYDPRYEQIKEARREDLELPPGGLATDRKIADWNVVVKLGRDLLEKETKDLQIAAWLTEGLIKREGFAGLATGSRVLVGIVDRFWDTCYPLWDEEDPEMRAGPLEWFGTKFDIIVKQLAIAPAGTSFLEYMTSRSVPTEAETEGDKEKRNLRAAMLGEGKPAPEAIDKLIAEANKAFYKSLVADLDAALSGVSELGKVCDQKFGRDAPSFLKVHGALDEVRRLTSSILAQKLVEDPDPIEEVPEEGAAVSAVDESGALTPEPVSPADAASRVAVSARYLRKVDPTNPGPYLMLRGLRWGELRASAQSGDFNPKLLEATPTAMRARLKGLLLDGKWPDLLELCETVMATPQGRGWLDLQRYALTACSNLGPSYDAVAAALRDELRVLLAAIPQLPEMTLMDDTPAANPETQQWLEDEKLVGEAATEATEATSESAPAPAIDEALVEDAIVQEASTSKHGGLAAGPRRRPAPDPFEMAKSEVRQGRPKKGFELLLAEVAREQSERGRFLRQVQLAYLMVEGGMDTVARPMLERLVAIIDEKGLEQWESGPLVAQPIGLLIRILDRAGETESSERYNLYQRICKLDSLQAMALSTS